ncbi:transposase [Streptomyces sp. NPDC007117]|uniref:transposase n=1 Tax=unclassified Streptomyces TaxID=2593676 RepID=UPI0034073836
MDTWRLGPEVPEEVAPGGKQVREAVHRGVQAGCDRLVDSSGKTVTAVARELGISSESLRGWYRRARADLGEGVPGELTSAEREELKRLRRENREQQQTIEILKEATAFFVKESDPRPVTMLYRLIHAEKANYPIVLLCRVLYVTRSSCYAWREGEAARRSRRAADDALAHEITVLHIASRRT